MINLKQKFAIAAITASVSFNALANDADAQPIENNVDNIIPTEQENTGLRPDEMDGFVDERFTTEAILAELSGLKTRKDVIEYAKDLKERYDVDNLINNIENPDSLDSYLEFTGHSPYVALSLMFGDFAERTYVFQPEVFKVLEKHGLDIKTVDDLVQIRTRGNNHIYDYMDSNIINIMENPYIFVPSSIEQDGYKDVPEAITRSIQDDLEYYQHLRSQIDPDYTTVQLTDISPHDDYFSPSINEALFNERLKDLTNEQYEKALLNRVRVSMPDVQSHLEKEYEGVTLEGGLHFQFANGLMLPEQNKDYTLIVTEPSFNVHSDVTHRYSEALATQISPDGEGASDVIFTNTEYDFSETEQLVSLAAYAADNIILSKSYGLRPTGFDLGDDFTNDVRTDRIAAYDFHNDNHTLQFLAAGNSHGKYFDIDDDDNVEYSYKHVSSVAFPEAHAQSSVVIGSAHINGDIKYMSSYTSVGADFLVETPDFYDSKAQGTSFATPTAAAYYHQIAESYGDVLTHEEIMTAALYSTETNVYNVNITQAKSLDIEIDPSKAMTNSITSIVKKNDKDLTPEQIKQFDLTTFRTNDAGIPHHERAGAGYLNVDTWIQNLEELKTIKGTFEHQADYIEKETKLASLETEQEDSQFAYRYAIKVDEDMTLDKQTLYLDQVGLNSVRITSPSGMEANFMGTLTGYLSTRAFTGEDIKAGQEIIIESNIALGELSEFTVRGHEDGNPLQVFRGHKNNNGGLNPNSHYTGDKEITAEQASQIDSPITRSQDHFSDIVNGDFYDNQPAIRVGPYIPGS